MTKNWFEENQGLLTFVMVLVLLASLGVQYKIYDTVYKPQLVPTVFEPPKEIENEVNVSVSITNYGGTVGQYAITIKTTGFLLRDPKYHPEKTKELVYSYTIGPQGKTDFFNFYISTVESQPSNAEFSVQYYDHSKKEIIWGGTFKYTWSMSRKKYLLSE